MRVPPYEGMIHRTPSSPLVRVSPTASELTGPTSGWEHLMGGASADLTRCRSGDALGERIIVFGRVRDEHNEPVPETMLEIWQANAAGRYFNEHDTHDAPIDPNFEGVGRVIADAEGRYQFTTIKPGAYPWQNHHNAWRPAHIHFSIFGRSFSARLVTQMYFPADPLMEYDAILGSIPRAHWPRLTCTFDLDRTEPEFALAYRFDVVVSGPRATPADIV